LLPILGAICCCKEDYRDVGRATLTDDLLAVLCELHALPALPSQFFEGFRTMGILASFNFRSFANSPQLTNADYSMDRFVKITGRRDDEGPVPELSPRSKSD
jgi:hypothetical protein